MWGFLLPTIYVLASSITNLIFKDALILKVGGAGVRANRVGARASRTRLLCHMIKHRDGLLPLGSASAQQLHPVQAVDYSRPPFAPTRPAFPTFAGALPQLQHGEHGLLW